MKRLSELNRNERRKLQNRLRALIQLLYFLFLPSAYTAAFSGVKYIFTQLGQGKLIELTPFVAVLIVLCLYTVVFGRFFCGFACAFGSLGDAVRAAYTAIQKKRKKKPFTIPEAWCRPLSFVKYGILGAIVLLCFFALYQKAQGTSPWDVFSMLHARNFRLGSYGIGIALLAAIVVGMAAKERFFCRFLCPMGAIFSLLPVLPLFSLRREREQCLKTCSACTRVCPSGISLPDGAHGESSTGDCFQCQKCIGTCPKTNVHIGISTLHGNEEYLTILRAVLLLGLMLLLGI